MNISISKNILKNGNRIEESFFVNPQHSILSDDHREIYNTIDLIILHMTISPEYRLIDVIGDRLNKKFIYEFEENKRIPKLFVEFKFEYFPNQKRKCTHCVHFKKFNTVKFCMFKSIKLFDTYYKNCNDWMEKSVTIGNIKDIIIW